MISLSDSELLMKYRGNRGMETNTRKLKGSQEEEAAESLRVSASSSLLYFLVFHVRFHFMHYKTILSWGKGL
ncbi:hypothetical protein E2C01_054055 [Portunus trituberculatus]|uniref:Uncharacterized protein n=1 Tax=Portunus trituberculatus TaxID=210409 RepID=A0A5B7GIV5_PORTR|nr:hypothetical protein [Portunus trituberculatus]